MEHELTVDESAIDLNLVVDRAHYDGEAITLVRYGQRVARVVPIMKSELLGKDLAAKWNSMSHLSPQEAEAFARDVEEARAKLKGQ